jgi:two-component system LytT family response regulator
MDTIHALVVDDEQPSRTRILDLIEKQPDFTVDGVARTGREAIDLILRHRPDMIFLDIQMPRMNGFDVLRALPPDSIPLTVFVTGYDTYAVAAFEANAADYLLKPFSDERFEAALQRSRNHLRAKTVGEASLRIAQLLDAQKPPEEPGQFLERLLVKSSGRVTFLPVADIDWIEAAGVYVHLHVGPKTHLYRATVGQLQERLDPSCFVRVHRSTIVNTTRILELQPRTHGEYAVILKSGAEVTLSRGYRAEFERWLRQPL